MAACYRAAASPSASCVDAAGCAVSATMAQGPFHGPVDAAVATTHTGTVESAATDARSNRREAEPRK